MKAFIWKTSTGVDDENEIIVNNLDDLKTIYNKSKRDLIISFIEQTQDKDAYMLIEIYDDYRE